MAALAFFSFKQRSLAPAILGIGVYAYTGVAQVLSVPWPHQAGMMQAGLFLKLQETQSVYASWRVCMHHGMLELLVTFMKKIVNLDGLANDNVIPFIISNNLLDYVKYMEIKYLVDYEAMIDNFHLRVRGGYLDERTDKCIRPFQTVGGEYVGWANSELKIFEVVDDCL